MIRTILLDDEYWVCKLLQSLVDWESFGFTLISQAYDGESGFQEILAQKPDLVFTDIRMSGMTGIELIERCRQASLDTQFVIISGYSDFEYAKAAIKNGVLGYLLKPVDQAELEDLLVQIHSSMMKSLHQQTETEQLQTQLTEKKRKYARQYLENLFSRTDSTLFKANAGQINQDCDLQFDDQLNYQMFLLAFDKRTQAAEVYLPEMEKLVIRCYREAEEWCREIIAGIHGGYVYCFANFASENASQLSQVLKKIFFSAKLSLTDLFGCDITLCVSEIFSSFSCLPQLFASAQEAYYARISLGTNRVIEAGNLSYSNLNESEIFGQDDRNLLDAFLCRKSERSAKQVVACIYEKYLTQPNPNPMQMVAIGSRILQYLFSVVDEPVWNALGLQNFDSAARILQSFSSEASFMDYLTQLLTRTEHTLNKDSKTSKAAHLLQAYLDEHYTEDISLDDLSQLVFLSSKYISDMFRSEVGVTITDYITAKRIERAKQMLLNSGTKIYEIADQLGFHDVKYFNKVFKKQIGISPLQFRKLYQ